MTTTCKSFRKVLLFAIAILMGVGKTWADSTITIGGITYTYNWHIGNNGSTYDAVVSGLSDFTGTVCLIPATIKIAGNDYVVKGIGRFQISNSTIETLIFEGKLYRYYYYNNTDNFSITNNHFGEDTSTEGYFFSLPALKTVYIPEGKDGETSWPYFRGCPNVKDVYINVSPSDMNKINYLTFIGPGRGNIKLHVPADAIPSDYSTTAYLSELVGIVPWTPTKTATLESNGGGKVELWRTCAGSTNLKETIDAEGGNIEATFYDYADSYQIRIYYDSQTQEKPRLLRNDALVTLTDATGYCYFTDEDFISATTYEVVYPENFLPVERDDAISFADEKVKAICLDKFDTNKDGALTYAEAAAVTSLGKAFQDNAEITSFDELRFFTGIKSIDSGGEFKNCTALQSLILPEGLEKLGVLMGTPTFYNCTSLEHLVLPKSLTTLQNAIRMSGIRELVIPDGVTELKNYNIFNECDALKSLYISKGTTSISYAAFGYCKYLQSIVVDEDNEVYDSRDYCNGIVETATNTLIIGTAGTVIPKSVVAIGRSAFNNRQELTEIRIPATVTSIGDYAFANSANLKSVVMESETPFKFGEEAFVNIYDQCVLTVPAGCKAAYIAKGWTTSVFKGGVVEAPSKFDVNEDGQISIADVTKLVNKILGKE